MERIRLIIVDDHSIVRQGLRAIFRVTPGIELIGEAANGREAVELAASAQPDLALMDLVMPEMDGPTLLKEMRVRNPDLKMIFVSGYAEEAFQKNLPPEGRFSFLAKPFTLKQLVAAVKETMTS